MLGYLARLEVRMVIVVLLISKGAANIRNFGYHPGNQTQEAIASHPCLGSNSHVDDDLYKLRCLPARGS